MITGGVKFFEPSLCLFKNGASATATSNSSQASLILNYDKETSWVSSGSFEGDTQTITIDLGGNKTFTRLFLLNHNFEVYTITYGAGEDDFENVITINGASYANIQEAGYSYDSSYYEFDQVTTNQINITCTNVQNAATTEEKYLSCLVVCEELGTMSVDGLLKIDPSTDANNRVVRNYNNKSVVQRGEDSFSCGLSGSYLFEQADIDILVNTFERSEDFLLWLCGGRVGTPYFRFNARPYRLLDLYRVQNIANLDNSFYKGLFNSGIINSVNLVEVEG